MPGLELAVCVVGLGIAQQAAAQRRAVRCDMAGALFMV